MKTTPDVLFEKIKTRLTEVAPTEVGFYKYPRSVVGTSITVQPSEVSSTKRSGEIQALIIITVDSREDGAAIALINLVQQVQQTFIDSQKINSNLGKLCSEVTEIENAKIIAPDPNQGTAQALLNFKFSFL